MVRKSHQHQGKHNALQKGAYFALPLLGIAAVLSGLAIWKPVRLGKLTNLLPLWRWNDGSRSSYAIGARRRFPRQRIPRRMRFSWTQGSTEPTITRIIKENKGKLEVIRIVVPQNQTPEKAAAFVAKNELPGVFLFDSEGAAYKVFAAYHTSYIVILDRQGKVLYSSDGGKQDLDAVIAEAIAK